MNIEQNFKVIEQHKRWTSSFSEISLVGQVILFYYSDLHSAVSKHLMSQVVPLLPFKRESPFVNSGERQHSFSFFARRSQQWPNRVFHVLSLCFVFLFRLEDHLVYNSMTCTAEPRHSGYFSHTHPLEKGNSLLFSSLSRAAGRPELNLKTAVVVTTRGMPQFRKSMYT